MACQNGPSPTPAPQGVGPSSSRLGSIPRPDLATIALGSSGPGYDGSSDFLSFASQLAPDRALAAYVNQLIDAGYRDDGRQGAWRVFVGATTTVWVRVGSAGPPTSLVVRFAPTPDVAADVPALRPMASAAPAEGTGTGGQTISNAPKPTDRPTSARRPDPPHAASQAGTGSPGGTASGGPATGGPASGSGSAGAGHSAGAAGGGIDSQP